jgi:hypothetical protein
MDKEADVGDQKGRKSALVALRQVILKPITNVIMEYLIF